MNDREEGSRSAEPRPNRRVSLRTPPRRGVAAARRPGRLGRRRNVATAVLELSQDGARLVVREALREGETVALTWTCPPRLRPLKRVGIVVWVKPLAGGAYCAGIRFGERLAFTEFTWLVHPLPRPRKKAKRPIPSSC